MSEADKSVQPEPKEATTGEPQAKSAEQAKRDKNRKANLAAMQLLLDAYPSVFNLEDAKPLKIGIHEALAEDGKLSKTKIRRALATYVRQTAYLKSLVAGAQRVNLAGEADGEVSADEAAHAQEELAKRRARRKPPAANKRSNKPANKRGPRKQTANKPGPRKQASKPEPEMSGSPEERMQKKLEQLLATMGKK